jgi:hypothetical protein
MGHHPHPHLNLGLGGFVVSASTPAPTDGFNSWKTWQSHPPLLQTDRASSTINVRMPMPFDSVGALQNFDSCPHDRAWQSECTMSCTVPIDDSSCFLDNTQDLVCACQGIVLGPLTLLRTASTQQDGIVTDRRLLVKISKRMMGKNYQCLAIRTCLVSLI